MQVTLKPGIHHSSHKTRCIKWLRPKGNLGISESSTSMIASAGVSFCVLFVWQSWWSGQQSDKRRFYARSLLLLDIKPSSAGRNGTIGMLQHLFCSITFQRIFSEGWSWTILCSRGTLESLSICYL